MKHFEDRARSAHGIIPRHLLLGVLACTAIGGYVALKTFRHPGDRLPKPQQSRVSPGRPQPAASQMQRLFASQLAVEMLKQEELNVAAHFSDEFPDSADALATMGHAHRNQGNSAEAAKYWEKCAALYPTRADIYRELGSIAMQKAEYEKAASQWRRALEIDPKMFDVYGRLASALICLGEADQVVALLKRRLPLSACAFHRYFTLGQAHLQRRDYAKAKECYLTAIRLRPDYTNAYYGLASVCARLKQPQEAKRYSERFQLLKSAEIAALERRNAEYDDLILIRKAVAKTHIMVARLFHKRGDVPSTETLYCRAAVLEPDAIGCRVLLAELYQADGRKAKAVEMYRQLAEIEPDNGANYANIGILCTMLDRFDEAEEALREAGRLAPEEVWGCRPLVHLYLKMDRNLLEAQRLAQETVRLDARPENYALLAEACNRNADLPLARLAIEHALRTDPENDHYRQLHEHLHAKK